MTMLVRTTEKFPKYLRAYYGDAQSVEWTFPDNGRWSGEDFAQEFNKIEAACIIEELAQIGISAELC